MPLPGTTGGSDFLDPPSPYGEVNAVDRLGGVAAPLMAGFALTFIGLVLSVSKEVRWPDASLAALVAAVVLLTFTVQCTFHALSFTVTPDEARSWYPDFDQDPQRRSRVWGEIRAHRKAYLFWARRARITYNAGVAFLLAGLTLALVPPGSASPTRWAAVGILLVGLLVELLWDIAAHVQRYRALPWRVRHLIWWAASGDPLLEPQRIRPAPGRAQPPPP